MTRADDAETRLLWILATATAITLSTFAGCLMAGCYPVKTAQKSAYMAESLECVEEAKTLDESRMCRDGVKARYMVVWGLDAGKDGSK